jgi:large subunit ribosomal protein L31
MKANIHPDYHRITIVMTDGETYQTGSTYGEEGDTIRLDSDYKSHPAWTGGAQQFSNEGRLASFNKKFSGFGLGTGSAKEKPAAETEKLA